VLLRGGPPTFRGRNRFLRPERALASLSHDCATDDAEKRIFVPLVSLAVTSDAAFQHRHKRRQGKDLIHKSLPCLMVETRGFEPPTSRVRFDFGRFPQVEGSQELVDSRALAEIAPMTRKAQRARKIKSLLPGLLPDPRKPSETGGHPQVGFRRPAARSTPPDLPLELPPARLTEWVALPCYPHATASRVTPMAVHQDVGPRSALLNRDAEPGGASHPSSNPGPSSIFRPVVSSTSMAVMASSSV